MKVATVVGTRPQFIKAAMVSRALRERLREIFIHTGQHYAQNMSGVFFSGLELPAPDYQLAPGAGTSGRQLARMLGGLREVFEGEKPSLVLVYGDSRTTLAGALAAAGAGIPLAHVEAGLRCHNDGMPEEYNRVVSDHLSTLLFCPSTAAVRNLENEGFKGAVQKGEGFAEKTGLDPFCSPCVVQVGDVMLDTLKEFTRGGASLSPPESGRSLRPGEYYLATVHRAENADHKERLVAILQGLTSIKGKVIFPVHPRTVKKIAEFGLGEYLLSTNLEAIEPVGYLEMIWLIKNARKVLTDSGGVQKEAFLLNVPCITLRDETEWVETVERGCNVLAGCDRRRIVKAMEAVSVCDWSGSPYGRGDAARLIARWVEGFLCRGS